MERIYNFYKKSSTILANNGHFGFWLYVYYMLMEIIFEAVIGSQI